MVLHIYREAKEGHLCQGDILRPEPLRPRLKGHQDYFANTPYFYRFMVLTQTCDLARETDRCNFIFIAVIRRLSEAIGMRQFEKGAIDTTRQLLTDILSHRYNKRGFFYLPEDNYQGIDEPSVVDLRVIFSLHKAHYGALLSARCGGLDPLYAVQLGQLTAQMFNRIAVPDVEKSVIKHETKSVMELIGDRERTRLEELLAATSDRLCAITACATPAETYRWLQVIVEKEDVREQERVLCIEHARQYDAGTLSVDCTVKSERTG